LKLSILNIFCRWNCALQWKVIYPCICTCLCHFQKKHPYFLYCSHAKNPWLINNICDVGLWLYNCYRIVQSGKPYLIETTIRSCHWTHTDPHSCTLHSVTTPSQKTARKWSIAQGVRHSSRLENVGGTSQFLNVTVHW
jgi:hypothetical protein